MSGVTFETPGGHLYRVKEPVGAAAHTAFHRAMAVMDDSGALDVIDSIQDHPKQNGRLSLKAARKLAAHEGALDEVRAVLYGGTVDGEVITLKLYTDTYSTHGRQVEPFFAAIVAWSHMGFFSNTGKKPEGPKRPKEPAPPKPSPDGSV